MEKLLGDIHGLEILDLGCGTGRHSIRMAGAGARITALDFSSRMLAEARKKAGESDVRFQLHDLSQPLPFPPESFDRVLCALVVDHIEDLDKLFTEMHRVCRPTVRANRSHTDSPAPDRCDHRCRTVRRMVGRSRSGGRLSSWCR